MWKFFTSSLRRQFTLLFGFQLCLILILGVLIFLLFITQKQLASSRDIHFNSYLLANELRQSSDDLTRMVRAYVSTGDSAFERNYWTILDIRNGIKPRPINYDRIYWDFFAATGKKPSPDGKKISLNALMVQMGFTEKEFEKLNTAQRNSDQLVKAETIAMNAMKGLFNDGTGHFTVKKKPDVEMANRLVNNAAYYQAKKQIMQPIDEFYQMFETRTAGAVAKYLQLSIYLFWAAMFLALFIIIIFSLSFILVRRQILKREQSEKELYDFQSQLEQKIKDRTIELEQSKVELEKSNKQIENKFSEVEEMNNLMVGRELRMTELKNEIEKLRKPMGKNKA